LALLPKNLRERLEARVAALEAQQNGSGLEPAEPGAPANVLAGPDGGPIEVVTVSAHDSDRSVPEGLQTAASWAWRVLIVAALALAIAYVLQYLSGVTIPLAVAILLAAMLHPVADRLQSWGVGRGVSTAVTVLGGLLVILGTLTLIGASIAGQGDTLGANVVSGFTTFVEWLRTGPLPLNESWFRPEEWGSRIQNFLLESQDTITRYAREIGTSVGHFLAGLAIGLFALFYFLYDGRGIFVFLLRFFPRGSRAKVDRAAL
jgi:predicted PurR-regulated permease PerM